MTLLKYLALLNKPDAYRGAIIAILTAQTVDKISINTPTTKQIEYCSSILGIMDDMELTRIVKVGLKELKIPVTKKTAFIDPEISILELYKSEPQIFHDILQWLANYFYNASRNFLSQKQGKPFDM